MKKFLFFALALLCTTLSYAQRLRVVDQFSLRPIAGVQVFDAQKKHQAITNAVGEIQLDKFPEGALLIFKHNSYETFEANPELLKKLGYTVRLMEKFIETDEVVVAANRWEQEADEVSAEILRMEAGFIANANPPTSADLIAETGEVYVQKSQFGGGSPMLRGFAANSVLLVLDGTRMNNAIFRGGNLQNVILLDPNVLEGAEVLFGPGSLMYGSDALGGVMHFRSRELAFSSEGFRAGGESLLRYGSAANEMTGHVQLHLQGGRVTSLTSLTVSDFDDLRAGANYPDAFPDFGKRPEYVVRENGEDQIVENDEPEVQKFSGYQQLNFMQKLRFKISERLEATYGFYYTTSSDIPRYDRLIQYRDGQPRNAEWNYGPQNWLLNSLRVNYFGDNVVFDHARLTLSYQNYQEQRIDRRFGDESRRTRTENVKAWNLNLDFEKKLHEKFTLFYGSELLTNDVQSKAERYNLSTQETTPTASRYPDGGSLYQSAAAYANSKFSVKENLHINGGLRYSYVRTEANFTKEFYDFPYNTANQEAGALTGALGLAWNPKNMHFAVQFGSGFRAPNVDDIGKVFDSEPGNVVVPNPTLRPEVTRSIEMSVERSFKDKFAVGGTIYHTWLRDAMVRRDFQFNGNDSILYDGEMSNVQAIVNAGTAYIWGYTLRARASLHKHLSLRGSVTYTEGFDTSGETHIPLRHVPPFFGRAEVRGHFGDFQTSFFVVFHDWKPYASLAPSEQSKTHIYTANGTPAWYTLNLRASWQVKHFLRLQVAAENLLDRHYRPFSSGISAPGRNLSASLRLNF